MDEKQTVERLLRDGWTVEPATLYDEEGVEGWCWTSPDGTEHYVSGPYSEGPVPPEDAP